MDCRGVQKSGAFFFALISFILCLSSPLIFINSAWAEESPITNILLEGNEWTSTEPADRYQAYQIFKGKVTKAEDGITDIIADVGWGSAITDPDAFLTALKTSPDFKDAEGGQISPFADCITAADVAQKLADETLFTNGYPNSVGNSEVFARIVSNFKADPHSVSVSAGDANFSIPIYEAGYYLIFDAADPNLSAVSANILAVAGTGPDTTIKIKSAAPTFDKAIPSDTYSYSLADQITYTLTATLPSNFDAYSEYTLNITDALPAGLSYVEGTLAVNVVTGDTFTPLDISTHAKYWTEGHEDAGTFGASRSFSIVFDNLKAVTTEPALTNSSIITVTYAAKLNEAAALGSDGNTNTATMTFSNNPNLTGDGKTTSTITDTETVYTLQVDLEKTDNTEDKKPLKAGFVLSREKTDSSVGDDDNIYWMIEEGVLHIGNKPYPQAPDQYFPNQLDYFNPRIDCAEGAWYVYNPLPWTPDRVARPYRSENPIGDYNEVMIDTPIAPVDMSYWFMFCDMDSIDLSNVDGKNLVDMSYMFYTSRIREITGMSSLDTSHVTNMHSFLEYGDDGTSSGSGATLKSIDLSGWDTSAVTDMHSMFSYCSSLKTIYASDWRDNVADGCDSSSMFYKCSNLPEYSYAKGADITQAYPHDASGGYFTAPLESVSISSNAINTANGISASALSTNTTTEYAIVDELGRVTGWTTEKSHATTIWTDITSGLGTIFGLGAGTYRLEEVEVPSGYNKMEDVIFTVTLTGNGDGSTTFTTNMSTRPDATINLGKTVYSNPVLLHGDSHLMFEYPDNPEDTLAKHFNNYYIDGAYLVFDCDLSWITQWAFDGGSKFEFFDEDVFRHDDGKYYIPINKMRVHLEKQSVPAPQDEYCIYFYYSYPYLEGIQSGELVFDIDEIESDGIASVHLQNRPADNLPETGGMGTTIFYLIGGLLLTVSVVIIVTRKRKAVNR